MIKYIKGDLFQTDAKVIVHGCNCQGKMCSGVAKIVKEKYPEAYKYYIAKKDNLILGNIYFVKANNKIIVNALTQEYYGCDGKQYVDYDAVRNCFRRLNVSCKYLKIFKIAMPKIGCGLGGGNWDIVSKIIEEELKDFEVLVYEL